MKSFDFDLIIIGGGAGGLVASKLALGLGKKVAIIEKDKLGGECTWTGCIPSKVLIKIANVAHQTKNLNKYGLKTSQDLTLVFDSVMSQVHCIREKVSKTHTPEIIEKLGIKIFFGSPEFINNHTIKIENKKLSAKKFIISTGSSPFVPPIQGIDQVDYLTNQTFFELEKIPNSLVIIGGGPIGAELSCALNKVGTQVTIIEMQDHILAREDEVLAQVLSKKFTDDGIKILTKTKVKKLAQKEGQIVVTFSDEKGTKNIKTEKILIATGRKPNLQNLNLKKAGVEYTKKGIIVNNKMQTSQKNIYACGDVVGPYQFSHIAEYQAIIATKNAFLPIKQKVDYSQVIWTTFTDPEFARIGLTEKEAQEKFGKNKVKTYKFEYKDHDRAVVDQNEIGLAKFVCDNNGKLLGSHILGQRAGELIHEVQLARKFKINFSKISQVIHAYPTYSEIVKKASRKCYVDLLQGNFFIKILKKIFGKK